MPAESSEDRQMGSETMLFATIAFWLALSLVLVLPTRWALLAYLILIQIDLSGTTNYSLGSLGIENAIKVVFVPTFLLYRMRPLVSLRDRFPKLEGIWLTFFGYTALSCVWSPYHLPAIKMMGYFYAYSVLTLVFVTAWDKKLIATQGLAFVIWFCLALAVIQTYMLGNEYGNPEYEFRFTTFTGAQSFAPFLLSLIVILWFSQRRTFWTIATIAAASVGLVLTGSRSIFLGFAWSIFVGAIYLGVQSGYKANLRLILKRTLQAGLAIVLIAILVFQYAPDNRVNQLLLGVFSHQNSLEDIGTFAWRFWVYQKALDELLGRSPARFALGSGTSSAATVMLDAGIETEDNVDPNRAINSDFLRTLYEWGVLGCVLLALLLGYLALICIRTLPTNSPRAWAFLAIFVPLIISMIVENILPDAGSPGGVGYLMVTTALLAAANQVERKAVLQQANTKSIPFPERSLGIQPGS